jgi:hypothetical protein
MKKLFIAICLMASCITMAQKMGEEAVFKECADDLHPAICTNEKIADDLDALVTPAITNELLNTGTEYFTLSLIFIIDAKGKVIPNETRILCEIEVIKKAALAYVASLPLFQPKDAKQKEKRDLFFNTLTYVRNDNGKGYHRADHDEQRLKNIKANALLPDQYPVYPGCEGINDTDSKCMITNMYKFISKKYIIPANAKLGQVKMRVTFVINRDGEVVVKKIDGGPEAFQKEVRKLMGKIPEIQPANISGIPLSLAFVLPFTINVND